MAGVLSETGFLKLKTKHSRPQYYYSSSTYSKTKSLQWLISQRRQLLDSETFSRLKQQEKAAATHSLAKGTNFNKIIAMLKEVIPQLSCPIALFAYYNSILKRGVKEFMTTLKETGIHELVVPDVPLEETEVMRKEAIDKNIEVVLLTTPTTPTE